MKYNPEDYIYYINDGRATAEEVKKILEEVDLKKRLRKDHDDLIIDGDRLLQQVLETHNRTKFRGEPSEFIYDGWLDSTYTIAIRDKLKNHFSEEWKSVEENISKFIYDYSSYEERQLIDDILFIYNGKFRNYFHYHKLMELVNEEYECKNCVTIKHTILSEDIFNYIRRKANNAKHDSDHR